METETTTKSPIETDTPEKPVDAAMPCSAPHWSVTFETHDEMYHPVWYGKKDGPPISRERVMRAAGEYLRNHPDWLAKIDMCEPVDY